MAKLHWCVLRSGLGSLGSVIPFGLTCCWLFSCHVQWVTSVDPVILQWFCGFPDLFWHHHWGVIIGRDFKCWSKGCFYCCCCCLVIWIASSPDSQLMQGRKGEPGIYCLRMCQKSSMCLATILAMTKLWRDAPAQMTPGTYFQLLQQMTTYQA